MRVGDRHSFIPVSPGCLCHNWLKLMQNASQWQLAINSLFLRLVHPGWNSALHVLLNGRAPALGWACHFCRNPRPSISSHLLAFHKWPHHFVKLRRHLEIGRRVLHNHSCHACDTPWLYIMASEESSCRECYLAGLGAKLHYKHFLEKDTEGKELLHQHQAPAQTSGTSRQLSSSQRVSAGKMKQQTCLKLTFLKAISIQLISEPRHKGQISLKFC